MKMKSFNTGNCEKEQRFFDFVFKSSLKDQRKLADIGYQTMRLNSAGGKYTSLQLRL